MKMAVFWDVAPCTVVASVIRVIALMMEAASTSETLVNLYQTTRRNNPEDSHLQVTHIVTTILKTMLIRVLIEQLNSSDGNEILRLV
jgi:hypothetical protein